MNRQIGQDRNEKLLWYILKEIKNAITITEGILNSPSSPIIVSTTTTTSTSTTIPLIGIGWMIIGSTFIIG